MTGVVNLLTGFNTQPPEGGCQTRKTQYNREYVSTHSHPKVAAFERGVRLMQEQSFNTQPPEGGCRFQVISAPTLRVVSTHSHPKVAAKNGSIYVCRLFKVSTHSHPKVAAPHIKKQEKSAD